MTILGGTGFSGLVLAGLMITGDAPLAPREQAGAALTPRQIQVPTDPVTAIALSPEGRRIAWVEASAAGSSLWLSGPTGTSRRLLRQTDAADLAWSADGEWLFLIAPGKLVSLTTAGKSGSGIITQLGGSIGRRYLGIDAARAAALVAEERDSDADGKVDRFALLRFFPGGKAQEIWSGSQRVSSAIVAQDGRIWLRLVGQDRVEISQVTPSGQARARYRCRPLERCSLISGDKQGAVYLLTSASADLDGIYRLDRSGPPIFLAQDPLTRGDGEGVVVDPVSGTPQVLHIPYAGGRAVGLSPDARAVIAALSRRHQRASELRIAGRASGRWLVGIRDGRRPAFTWELADDKGLNWRPALSRNDAPSGPSGAPLRQFESFTASDGMRIFAYVTRPAQITVSPRPLVVLVHGGPWSVSPPGYNATSARLAAAGYLVVEPQFRASRGYGRNYMISAGDDFGDGRVLGDIRDSARWLVLRHEADRNRIAIMGASFGGYAALMATTLWPDIFHGAVAVVPPTDMGWVARYQAMSEQGDDAGLSLQRSFAHLGLDIGNSQTMRRLSVQSPAAMAQHLRRPVLLLAGDHDDKVPIRSVNAYAARLCSQNKVFTYYVAQGEGHNLGSGKVSASANGLVDWFIDKILAPEGTPGGNLPAMGAAPWPGLTSRGCELVH